MAKSTPSQLDRSRPSSRLQAQTMLETTPVLFRLPSVQMQPLPPVADMPTESLMGFVSEANAESAPAPTPLPVSITSQPAEADEPPRTWWEHWSSGVILILLLVAAYFACIAVLRSRGHAGSNTIAQDKSEFGDLTDVRIPPVVSSPTDQPQSVSTPNPIDNNAADALVNSLVSPPAPIDNSFSNNSLTLENPASTQSQPLATAQLLEPLQLPGNSLQLVNESDASHGSSIQAQAASTQLGQSPSLYDGANHSGLNGQSGLLSSPSSLVEPSLPAFTPAALNNANAPTGMGPTVPSLTLSNPPLSNQPSLGGNLAATLTPTVSGQAPTLSNPLGASASPSTAIPNLVPGVSGKSAAASTVSNQQITGQSGNGLSNSPSTSSNVRSTSTPDSNGEAESIIKAYVELMRAGQAAQVPPSQGSTANRYQSVR